MPLDARFDVADVMVDQRATHFWDNTQLVSDDLAAASRTPGQLVWDAFYVFGPDASWGARPPRPLGSGSPVVDHMASLLTLLRPYLT
jgi:hypothetical protein